MPVVMIINSSKLKAAGFTRREVFPPELESVSHRRCTHGAGTRQLEGMVSNNSCHEWMMTLCLVHNVSECVFVYFHVIVGALAERNSNAVGLC